MAEFETLCGRVGAFTAAMNMLLGPGSAKPLARGVCVRDDPQRTRTWWFWPWKLDLTDERGPWWRCHAHDIRAHAQSSPHRFDLLSIALPIEPEHPDALVAILLPWLREVLERPHLEIELLGPQELLRRHPPKQEAGWDVLILHRALVTRRIEYSKLEQQVVALLDVDPESAEAWSILADQLLASGSASGELLAVDCRLATSSDPNERAQLEAHCAQLWHDHDAYPLRRASSSGLDISGHDKSSRVWAAWRGPFISRLLVQGPIELCKQLYGRPEARYLSPRRVAKVGWLHADLSSWNLSGWKLGALSCDRYSFVESDLRSCDFEGTMFHGCSFDGADLRGASFRGASLIRGCRFTEARVSPDTAKLLERVAIDGVLERLSIEG